MLKHAESIPEYKKIIIVLNINFVAYPEWLIEGEILIEWKANSELERTLTGKLVNIVKKM